MKIAVIGAGAAGMTAAYSLIKENKQVDVYEATSSIGGLAGTLTLWNQKVDIGPHRFFSNDLRVNALWLEMVGQDYAMIDRLTRIYYKKRFYTYPIKVSNTLKNLGAIEATRCVLSYLQEQTFASEQDGSFETWIQSRFGKRLFEIFFKNYSEKLWGISCKEIDADFAAQRIKKLSLYESIKNAFLNGKGNKHKTLVDQFAYPTGGSGVVYERMADKVRNSGNNIFLNTPVYRIITNEGKVLGIELEDGTYREYDHVISSMPYTTMVKRLTDVPENIKHLAGQLRFRNTVVVYLQIDSQSLFPDNWLYVHSPDLKMGRVTNFRNWVPNLYGDEQKTIIAIEYWCNDDDSTWHLSDDAFIKLASKEIASTGLVDACLIKDGFVYRIRKSYPIYSKGYKKILSPIEDYICSIRNLSVIGRYGSFKYNNQDHSILMGLLAAENILSNADHRLCDVNTDYETYQESSIITKTGLCKQ